MVNLHHGEGLGGGCFHFSAASPSMRFTSRSPGWILSASSNFRLAPFQSSVKKSWSPANHAWLNLPGWLSLTGWSATKFFTVWAGMAKLKPWTMLPSAPGASDTKVRTPTSSALVLMAGPPELPQAADASVWMNGWLALSSFKPETAPVVIEASRLSGLFGRAWERARPA